jgi:hypothetical protein
MVANFSAGRNFLYCIAGAWPSAHNRDGCEFFCRAELFILHH